MEWIWIIGALGLVAGLMESWTKNQNKTNNNIKQKEFNSKVIGIILIVIIAILGMVFFAKLNDESLLNFNNEKYEEIAKDYIEQSSKEYLSYMTLVDTNSYSLDKEVRVTLKYRFTEGPNTSYVTYTVVIDKDTKKVVGINHY